VVLLLSIFIALLGPFVNADLPLKVSLTPQASNSITGHVSDAHRAAIPNLQVELLDDVETVIQRTKTDGSGRFAFMRMSIGTFQIRVQTYGTSYLGQTKRIELDHGRRSEQVDFVLGAKETSLTTTTPGAVFIQEVPEQARRYYEQGTALLQKSKQSTEGLETLKKAIDVFPNYFDALQLLGTEYVKQEKYDLAIPLLTKAIEVNRRAYPSLYALSLAQYYRQQLPQAVESMKRAITLNQKSTNANLWLGMLLRQSKKLDEAETYLKQADQLAESKLSEVHWQLALLFNQVKRYKEAADELELFLKTQPNAKDTELIKKLIQRFREQAAGMK
jgi:predicted Zn-dependent protease